MLIVKHIMFIYYYSLVRRQTPNKKTKCMHERAMICL